jgi:hypothetical protein
MPILYRASADLVVILHAGWVMFVVLGQAAILYGWLRRQAWIRSFWFRTLHLAAIGGVAVESVCGITCPLTTLEKWLRTRAGIASYEGDFIATFVHDALFVDWPDWVFTSVYIGFGALVLATFVCIPPNWPRRSARQSVASER